MLFLDLFLRPRLLANAYLGGAAAAATAISFLPMSDEALAVLFGFLTGAFGSSDDEDDEDDD